MTSSKRRFLSLLPFELVEEILYRLPIESLVRFKSICKQWNALFNDKRFIYKHLDLSKEGFLQGDHELVKIFNPETKALLCLPTPEEFKNHELIKTIHCDGLLIFHCAERVIGSGGTSKKLAVWNPILSRVKWIKPSSSYKRIDVYGFGHDNVSRDNYKILRIDTDTDHQGKFLEIEIYEFKSKLWRSVDGSTLECDALFQSVFMNGNMYWIAQKTTVNSEIEILIQSFDFSTETFKPICRVPKGAECCRSDKVLLSGFGRDRLSLLHQHEQVKIEVWVTSKVTDGIVSWSKYLNVALDSPTTFFPTCFFTLKTNKIMLLCLEVMRELHTYVYEIGEGEFKKLVEITLRLKFFDSPCKVYVSSLVPVPI